MGKREFIITSTILALLVSMLIGMQAVEPAKTNWIPSVSIDSVNSPVNGTTYKSSPVLEVVIFFSFWHNRSQNVAYSLDGKDNQTLIGTFSPHSEEGVEIFRGSTLLPTLSNGLHNVAVYAWADAQDSQFEEYSSKTCHVYFNINASITQTPTLLPVTSPTQTPKLEPSYTPVDGPYTSEPDFGWIPYALAATTIIIIAVFFYFKKTRK